MLHSIGLDYFAFFVWYRQTPSTSLIHHVLLHNTNFEYTPIEGLSISCKFASTTKNFQRPLLFTYAPNAQWNKSIFVQTQFGANSGLVSGNNNITVQLHIVSISSWTSPRQKTLSERQQLNIYINTKHKQIKLRWKQDRKAVSFQMALVPMQNDIAKIII